MALNNDAKMVFIEKYMDAADEKNLELIKEKMTLWVNSCDARNEAARNSARLYFSDDSDNVIAQTEKNLAEMKRAELDCRSDLGRQIAFYVTILEYRQMDLNRPGQIIDWAINEAMSPIPTQAACWDWVLEIPGVIYCNPGPNNDIQLEHILLDYEPDLLLLYIDPSSSMLPTDPSSSVPDGANASKKKKKNDSQKKNKKENSRKKNLRG